MRFVTANQATAAKRRVYFDCRDATDGITPETGEAAGQPQISTNGGAWTDTGIGTLSAIGNGRYYADLTQAAVTTAGDVIETRYKSANTAETPGDSVQVVAIDLDTSIADSVWDEVLTGATHNAATSAGRRLRVISGFAMVEGTLAAGGAAGTSTCTLNGNALATSRLYEQNLLAIVSGAGAGQSRMIIQYSPDGANRIVTVERPWDVTVDATSEYQVQANSGLIIVHNGVAQAGAAGSITLDLSASTTVDIYKYCLVYIGSGTGAGQTRLISAYSTGRVATIEPNWSVTPDSTSAYKILPVGLSAVQSLTADALAAVNAEVVDAAPTATEIDTELTSTHGAGSWAPSASANLTTETTIIEVD